MKTKKQETRRKNSAGFSVAGQAARERSAESSWLLYVLAGLAALIAVFVVYSPSLHGPFQFDDTTLPFSTNTGAPFLTWVRDVRPVLMATYWLNAQISGDDPYSYHVVSVLIHWIASGFIFLIVRRLLEWGGVPHSRRTLLAGFAAAVFLLHPAQTEAVAYVAGRSESLSAMLVFAAFTVFLYRPKPEASWWTAAAVLALFGAAVLAKEQTVALVGLLLFTDFWWNPGFSFKGIRGNWKLYLPIALGAAAGVYRFRALFLHGEGAGFGMKDPTWYEYFFTQWRALFVYPFQFLLPVNLTADWNFPFSRNIFDHGAIFGLIGLLALAGAAWYFRKRYPLACYGFFVYLLLMGPTSSIVPIKDAVAERRLYFSVIGLLLIVVDLLGRLKVDRKQLLAGCSVVVLLCAVGTYLRAEVWGDPVALWSDTVAKSPSNRRAHFQLAYAHWTAQHPDAAVAEFQRTAALGPVTWDLLLDWGLALDSLHQPDQALEKLKQSAALEANSGAYLNMAKIYAERGQAAEGLQALDTAQKLDPGNINVFNFRGKIYLMTNRVCEAIAQYQLALAIDPKFADARQDLARAQRMPHECR
jgi:tetratricopeptide (TPR) repeat protein